MIYPRSLPYHTKALVITKANTDAEQCLTEPLRVDRPTDLAIFLRLGDISISLRHIPRSFIGLHQYIRRAAAAWTLKLNGFHKNRTKIARWLVFQCRWKYAIWISAFRRYHVCTEDWLQPAERTRPDRKGIGFARPSPGPIRPHDRTVRAGRQWTTIDREHHITADPDGRPHPLHGRPDVREQEAHLCSFDNSQPN
ncbi:unnamed protein product [Microthlaspi erraticum]|uniref:Uncharacterized protein n=1 Tax=Microthlaspi erraticum TaxID=1685480 RepID=A0A6D2I470_9BRAS|nr:unnamed protein product [Microthlaspi erraticum]